MPGGKSISVLIPPELSDDLPSIMSHLKKGESINHYKTVRVNQMSDEFAEQEKELPIIMDSDHITGINPGRSREIGRTGERYEWRINHGGR